MSFLFSASGLTGREKRLQRIFEIIPGFLSWFIILSMVFMAVFYPLLSAVIIIGFYFYWILRLLYMTLFLVLSYFRLSCEKETNWLDRAKGMDDLENYIGAQRGKYRGAKFREKISIFFHLLEMEKVIKDGSKRPLCDEIYHLVVIPVVKEGVDVVGPGIKSIAESSMSSDQIILVIALEGRANENVKKQMRDLRDTYKNRFFDFLIFEHPDNIKGEIKAKGANISYAAKQSAGYFMDKKIGVENIILSCFDADTVVTKDYFASLTYYFLICPEREKASFQPIPVYNNNIWQAPGITRVLEIGSSFFQLIEATNPEKLVTFSSHSMSFKALVEIGYWPVDMVSDDSAVYWKAFIHYDGKYTVVPMYTTISMDAVVAENWKRTVVNVYKQKRRWAWGVENFPILMRAFLQNTNISFCTKVKKAFRMLEGHVSWATWGFLLTVIGWLPALLADRDYARSVFYYSEPRIARTVFNLASISLITSIILSQFLIPPGKEKFFILKKIGLAFQWLLIPFTIVFLSAMPALDAQTRLMLGKYMGFWVTDKVKNK